MAGDEVTMKKCKEHTLYEAEDFDERERDTRNPLYVAVVEDGRFICKQCGEETKRATMVFVDQSGEPYDLACGVMFGSLPTDVWTAQGRPVLLVEEARHDTVVVYGDQAYGHTYIIDTADPAKYVVLSTTLYEHAARATCPDGTQIVYLTKYYGDGHEGVLYTARPNRAAENWHNRQPFYHQAVVTFTAVRGINEHELLTAIQVGFDKDTDILKESIHIEDYEEPEAGDPADLM